MNFELSEDRMKLVNTFIKEHECSLERDEFGFKKCGPIGGDITYCFTPTSLGNIEVVKCLCGKKINITPFECW
jgi:hypothetical protein